MTLEGARVIVTRASHQASALSDLLARVGAHPIEVPVIEIVSPDDGGHALQQRVQNLDTFDWLVFTSVNTVERVVALLDRAHVPKVAAIGPGTAAALESADVHVDLVPETFVAEALVEAFPSGEGKVLLPRAEVARAVLPDGLREKGWDVEVVVAYKTMPAPVGDVERELVSSAGVITFTASSTVENYVESFGNQAPPVVACIGPVTARTAREHGIEVTVTASEHTIEGLVDALSTP